MVGAISISLIHNRPKLNKHLRHPVKGRAGQHSGMARRMVI
jgi:hypothetical protein